MTDSNRSEENLWTRFEENIYRQNDESLKGVAEANERLSKDKQKTSACVKNRKSNKPIDKKYLSKFMSENMNLPSSRFLNSSTLATLSSWNTKVGNSYT